MRFASVVIATCYLLLATHASPVNIPPSDEVKSSSAKRVPCDEIAKYKVDWFIENTLVGKEPKPSSCLFYTRGLSQKAKYYAKEKAIPPLTTIWDVWPPSFYSRRISTNNPLRCIMQNKQTDQRTYFENMSGAFASMCQDSALVMDASITLKNKTFDTVDKAGIWFRTEFPILQRGLMEHKVNLIEAISPDGQVTFPYWERKTIPNHELRRREPIILVDEDYNADAEAAALDEIFKGTGLDDGSDEQGAYTEWWEEDESPDALDSNELEYD